MGRPRIEIKFCATFDGGAFRQAGRAVPVRDQDRMARLSRKAARQKAVGAGSRPLVRFGRRICVDFCFGRCRRIDAAVTDAFHRDGGEDLPAGERGKRRRTDRQSCRNDTTQSE